MQTRANRLLAIAVLVLACCVAYQSVLIHRVQEDVADIMDVTQMMNEYVKMDINSERAAYEFASRVNERLTHVNERLTRLEMELK